jgi:NhaP-type Na+/H+ and K+/H+ antiporter
MKFFVVFNRFICSYNIIVTSFFKGLFPGIVVTSVKGLFPGIIVTSVFLRCIPWYYFHIRFFKGLFPGIIVTPKDAGKISTRGLSVIKGKLNHM